MKILGIGSRFNFVGSPEQFTLTGFKTQESKRGNIHDVILNGKAYIPVADLDLSQIENIQHPKRKKNNGKVIQEN